MPRSPKPPGGAAETPSGPSLTFVGGSVIQTVASGPVAFPGPLRGDGTPHPQLLRSFIRQSQFTQAQARMTAGDWNNLGYAHASLPEPNLEGAVSALTRALALAEDASLRKLIQRNLTVVREALPQAGSRPEEARRPGPLPPPRSDKKLPLPDRAAFHLPFPLPGPSAQRTGSRKAKAQGASPSRAAPRKSAKSARSTSPQGKGTGGRSKPKGPRR